MASTHLLCTGKIVDGELEMALPGVGVIMTKHAYVEYLCSLVEDEVQDGELQRMIWESQELEDQIEGRMDEEWIRRGC